MKKESLGLRYDADGVWILDQTLLPFEEKWILSQSPLDMVGLIQRLAVRGAPLIGVAAALALGHGSRTHSTRMSKSGQISQNDFAPSSAEAEFHKQAHILREARPTAVNLQHAIDRCLKIFERTQGDLKAVEAEALQIFDEDVELCSRISRNGVSLIQDGEHILTHCNTGGLATAGIGTALGVILGAHRDGKKIHVYVDETRPLLQGLRLTAWELQKLGIPFTVITDSMAAWLMSQKKIHRVIVGADRIAANGDSANKIGTYGLAIAARYHGVPFHIAAPRSTFDPTCKTGKDIPIELRKPEEVLAGLNMLAPVSKIDQQSHQVPSTKNNHHDYQAWNPSFDVTPAELITSIIFDDGIWHPTTHF